MGFNRTWLEDSGSEDSHGRTLWALGRVRAQRRQSVAPPVGGILVCRGACRPRKRFARRARGHSRCWVWTPIARWLPTICAPGKSGLALADRLMAILGIGGDAGLGVVRGRACLRQRALAAGPDGDGHGDANPSYVDAGLRSLRWLMTQQTAARRVISARSARPVSASSGKQPAPSISNPWKPRRRSPPASRHGGRMAMPSGKPWRQRAFAWFLGSNDLSVPLVDLQTGSCRDGLHPDRANENRGRRVGRVLSSRSCRDSPACARQHRPGETCRHFAPSAPEFHLHTPARRGHRVTSHLPEPAGALPASRPRAGDCASVQASDRTARPQPDRQDARQPYCRPGSRARFRGGCQPTRRRPGEFPGPPSQPAGDVRSARRRNGRGLGGSRHFFQGAAPTDRRLFSQRIFVRGLGVVQSQHRAASGPVRRAGRRPCASFSVCAPSAKGMCRR